MSSEQSAHPRLAERVSSVPLLGKAFNVLSTAYDRYGKHSDIEFVRNSVNAVEHRLQGKLTSVESLVCAGLDRIEGTVSSITSRARASHPEHPPHHKTYAEAAAEPAAPEHAEAPAAAAGAAHEDSQHKSAEAKRKHKRRNHSAHALLTTAALSAEHFVAYYANAGVTVASNIVDSLLPTASVDEKPAPDGKQPPKQSGEASPQLGGESAKVLHRIGDVTFKARHRLVDATWRRLHSLQERGQQASQHLQEYTLNLLPYARTTATNAASSAAQAGQKAVQSTIAKARARTKTHTDSSLAALRQRIRVLKENRHVVLLTDLANHALDVARPYLPAFLTPTSTRSPKSRTHGDTDPHDASRSPALSSESFSEMDKYYRESELRRGEDAESNGSQEEEEQEDEEEEAEGASEHEADQHDGDSPAENANESLAD